MISDRKIDTYIFKHSDGAMLEVQVQEVAPGFGKIIARYNNDTISRLDYSPSQEIHDERVIGFLEAKPQRKKIGPLLLRVLITQSKGINTFCAEGVANIGYLCKKIGFTERYSAHEWKGETMTIYQNCLNATKPWTYEKSIQAIPLIDPASTPEIPLTPSKGEPDDIFTRHAQANLKATEKIKNILQKASDLFSLLQSSFEPPNTSQFQNAVQNALDKGQIEFSTALKLMQNAPFEAKEITIPVKELKGCLDQYNKEKGWRRRLFSSTQPIMDLNTLLKICLEEKSSDVRKTSVDFCLSARGKKIDPLSSAHATDRAIVTLLKLFKQPQERVSQEQKPSSRK